MTSETGCVVIIEKSIYIGQKERRHQQFDIEKLIIENWNEINEMFLSVWKKDAGNRMCVVCWKFERNEQTLVLLERKTLASCCELIIENVNIWYNVYKVIATVNILFLFLCGVLNSLKWWFPSHFI